MAVEKPRSSVISHETNCYVIRVSSTANADHVTNNRVVVVIRIAPCTSNDMETMAMKMNGMLS